MTDAHARTNRRTWRARRVSAGEVLDEVEVAVVGKRHALTLVLAAILAGGHVLLEDFPGLGKTLAARSFAQTLGLNFARAQFTPDLLPSDLTGAFVFDQRNGEFSFRRGPLFTGLLLADEINRTPPRTQSALLEAMQEHQITVEGQTFVLEPPFHVLATANPIEYEGTYPLPEAQLDRFMMRTSFGYPSVDDEWDVLHRRMDRRREDQTLRQITDAATLIAMQEAVERVTVDESVGRYCVALATATRTHQHVLMGASPPRLARTPARRPGLRRHRRPRLRDARRRQGGRRAGARPPHHGQAGDVDEPGVGSDRRRGGPRLRCPRRQRWRPRRHGGPTTPSPGAGQRTIVTIARQPEPVAADTGLLPRRGGRRRADRVRAPVAATRPPRDRHPVCRGHGVVGVDPTECRARRSSTGSPTRRFARVTPPTGTARSRRARSNSISPLPRSATHRGSTCVRPAASSRRAPSTASSASTSACGRRGGAPVRSSGCVSRPPRPWAAFRWSAITRAIR